MSGTISPQWSVAQCCEWLQSIGMGSYSSAFQAQQVDGALLLNLDDEMLQELGMDSKLQRTRLLLKRDAASSLGAGPSVSPNTAAAAMSPLSGSSQSPTTIVPERTSSGPAATSVRSPTVNNPSASVAANTSRPGMPPLRAQQSQPDSALPGAASSRTGSAAATPTSRPARTSSQGPTATSSSPRIAQEDPGYLAIESTGGRGAAAVAGDSEAAYLAIGSDRPDNDDAYMSIGGLSLAGDEQPPPEHDTYMELARTSKSTEVYNPLAEGFTGKDFKRQATSHVSAFKKALDHICNMFPKMPRTTIEEVLKRYKCDVSKTVDELLTMESMPELVQKQPAHRVATDRDADWLHGAITRETAEKLLRQYGASDGLFLVRKSISVDGAYVLSLSFKGEILHHIVYAGADHYMIFDITTPSLTDMVAYLSDFQRQDGWYTPLTQHVPRDASLNMDVDTSDSLVRQRAQSVHMSKHRANSASAGSPAASAAAAAAAATRNAGMAGSVRTPGARSAIAAGGGASPRFGNVGSPGRVTSPPLPQMQGHAAAALSEAEENPPADMVAATFTYPERQRSSSLSVRRQPSKMTTVAIGGSSQAAEVAGAMSPPLPQRNPSKKRPVRFQDAVQQSFADVEPYTSDQKFKAIIHISADTPKLGFPQRQVQGVDCVLRTVESGIEILDGSSSGDILAEINYGHLAGVDFTDDKKLVRFHVDDGPCVGVYYFTCQKAAKLHDVIERNRERFRMIEDLRFARLIQNEEFLQQLQSSSEFSAAMAAEQPSMGTGQPMEAEQIYAATTKSSKVRKTLSHLARAFTVKKRSKAPKEPQSSAARPAALPASPPTVAQEPLPMAARAYLDEEIPTVTSPSSLTRPTDPLPPVPLADDLDILGDEQADDMAWEEPNKTYALVRPVPEADDATGNSLPGMVSRQPVSSRPVRAYYDDVDLETDIKDQGSMEYVAVGKSSPSAYDPSRLTFNEGDVIFVTSKHPTGEWEGLCKGKSGFFPSVLVRPRFTSQTSAGGAAGDGRGDAADNDDDGGAPERYDNPDEDDDDDDALEIGPAGNGMPPPDFDAPHRSLGFGRM